MKLFDEMRSFILEKEFSIHIYQNKINIVNYDSIGHFDRGEVHVNYSKGKIVIKGRELVVSKLMQEEILISGNIQTIEFR